jgi:hypothetical protein
MSELIITNNDLINGTLPAIQEGVTKLSLGGCTSLSSLPANLPSKLIYLNLNGCTNLRRTTELLQKLKALEDNGCDVRWPEHISRNNQTRLAQRRLNRIIDLYKADNPNEPRPDHLVQLVHRYLTEGIDFRGGSGEVIESVVPVLDFIEKNPGHLKWMDELACVFLAGCVNQPVAGWSNIVAWISVAKAESLLGKIEAARQLMALDTITEFVIKANPQPKTHVQLEAGNALFREVHKKLVEGGMPKWLGVPNSMRHEESITTWLTQSKINAAHKIVKATLAKPLAEVANYLCETSQKDTWATVAFAEQTTAIEQDFSKRLSAVELALEVVCRQKKVFEAIIEAKDGGFAVQFTLLKAKLIARKIKELTQNAIVGQSAQPTLTNHSLRAYLRNQTQANGCSIS